jgi:FKBP-type peptidyl-prolyl cis-trans isomerase FklB
MKIKGLVVLSMVLALVAGSCAKSTVQNAKIKSKTDSLSYAIGIFYHSALSADSLELNPVLVAKAMLDGQNGKSVMTEEVARGFITLFVNQREEERAAQQEEANKVIYKEYIASNEAFLAENKQKGGVLTTESGLQYEILKLGTGPKPTAESTVKVHYVGTLIDGTQFDSSIERNEPAEFPVSGVIPGWTEALQLMPVGSKFKICIPESLAYGAGGAGEQIKPFSALIFEVELLEIVQ